jgi:ABC-type branched-subunit amino acid transport system ATPase component
MEGTLARHGRPGQDLITVAGGRPTTLDRVCEILPVLSSRARQRAGSRSGGEEQMLAIGPALMMPLTS